MTNTSDRIEWRLSYALDDWAVTAKEEREIIALLVADPNASQTVLDMQKNGTLRDLFDRVDDDDNLLELVQVLGGSINTPSAILAADKELQARAMRIAMGSKHPHDTQTWKSVSAVQGSLPYMLRLSAELQASLRASAGGKPPGAGFSASLLALAASLAGKPDRPFSGLGATGSDPRKRSIGPVNSIRLMREDKATVAQYSNPIPGSLAGYLASLTAAQRRDQATVLLTQPIFSVLRHAYLGRPPSRAALMERAATAHRLEPALIAAFILAEQRDQSALEDAKDYTAAVAGLTMANTSIGLGQVVVSTARKHDLFADLLEPATRKALSHQQIAVLLVSDDFNIFCVARYLRIVADQAKGLAAAALPQTVAKFPGLVFADYAKPSKDWPADNIRALGSEYTSRAWDDVLVPAWGEFVYQAFSDVRASRVSRP